MLVDDLEVLLRFFAKSLELVVHKADRFPELLQPAVDRLEAHIDVTSKFRDLFPAAIVLIESPVDRRQQLLVRHNFTVPRTKIGVKKFSPV